MFSFSMHFHVPSFKIQSSNMRDGKFVSPSFYFRMGAWLCCGDLLKRRAFTIADQITHSEWIPWQKRIIQQKDPRGFHGYTHMVSNIYPVLGQLAKTDWQFSLWNETHWQQISEHVCLSISLRPIGLGDFGGLFGAWEILCSWSFLQIHTNKTHIRIHTMYNLIGW